MKEKLLAFQLSGSHYKQWDSSSAKVKTQEMNPESMDSCIDTIVTEAHSNPKSKLRVAISTASDVDKDSILSANNYPIRDQKRGRNSRFDFESELTKKLHEANIDRSRIDLTLKNDAELQLSDAAMKFKLKKGARALSLSLGTGFNLKDGRSYKANGDFQEIESASRIKMPDLEKYQALEGPIRTYSSSDNQGSAAAYIVGGQNDNDTHGPKGTLNYLFKLFESESKADKRELQKALKILLPNKGIRARLLAVVGLGNRARKKQLEQSLLQKDFQKSKKLTNEAIEEAAKKGDKLALAMLCFIAQRTAQVIKSHLEATNNQKDPEAIYLSGGFANSLYNSDSKQLKLVRKTLEKELSKITKAKLQVHNPELDGAIELLEMRSQK